MIAFQLLGLVLAIAVLIIMIMKGFNAIVSSIAAALVAGLTNGFGIWQILNDFYVPGFLGFAGKMFFVFMLATIYGKVLGVSGSAHRIAYTFVDLLGAKRAFLVVGLTTGVLVYGGVSAMVVIFAVLPIAYIVFKEANVTKALLPATITWGQATFAMGAFPGSPQNPNTVPTAFFNTTPTAGPILGTVAGIVMFVLGLWYLEWADKKYKAQGIGFDPQGTIGLKMENNLRKEDCPGAFVAFAPLVFLIVVYLLFANVMGMPAITAVNSAMFLAIILVFILNPKKFQILFKGFMDGSKEWIMPLFNFTCMIAFGAVVQGTPGFAVVAEKLLTLGGSVYISAFATTTIMCAITGNGSGGSTIAMNAMAGNWLTMGANPAVLHRIVAITSTGLDSLPHCGGITTVYGLCNEDLGKQYKHAFVTTCVVPIIGAIVAIILAGFGIC